MSHRDRFIFTQALAKPIVEAYFREDNIEQSTSEEIADAIRGWCKFLYNLAGELEPKENDEYTKIHHATLSAYRRRAITCIENDDHYGIAELRAELTPGQWAYFMSDLYSEHANEVKRLCDLADELELSSEG